MIPVFDLSTHEGRNGLDQRLAKRQAAHSVSSGAVEVVAGIIKDVGAGGDEALVRYMRKWTNPDFEAGDIRVTAQGLDEAEATLDPDLRHAIEASIDHVRQYQQHILPKDPEPVSIGGAELGMRFTPVDSAGLAVPGGTAALFSTLIMLAVPAQVAGVDPSRLSVINPPPTRQADQPPQDISPIVLATCKLLGIARLYRIGGAQGIAALALGTEQVEKVDFIAGPGNVFVQLAKQQVMEIVGTDGGSYGPSEILTVADESADPRLVACDLIAQAEHDAGKCFLVAWSRGVIDRVQLQVTALLAGRPYAGAIEAALRDESAAILVANEAQAVEVANTIAAEHVNLAVADPDALLKQIRHGGAFFLGTQTPVAAGDYYAGPSHCLPTSAAARFASGVSAYTFLKRSSTVHYRGSMPDHAIEAIARLAQAEALPAHAASARARRK